MNEIKQIQQAISNYFEIPIEDFNKGLKREKVWCRQFTWLFAKRHLKLSLYKLGMIYTKDHATALYGIKKMNILIEGDAVLKLAYEEINKEVVKIFSDEKETYPSQDVLNFIYKKIDALVNKFIYRESDNEKLLIMFEITILNRAINALTGRGELQTKVIT